MGERLKGKVAFVTGAGSAGPGWGNGKAAAALFAREGAKVYAVDINSAALEETMSVVRSEGGLIDGRVCDVTLAADVQDAVAHCQAAFGTIDVLHNNVGTYEIGGPEEATEESWDRVHDINLKSAFLCCKYVLPVMAAGGGGAVVNVSSIASIRWAGVPYLSYYTSKAALNTFSKMIAREYAPKKIRSNAILPGLIDTPQIRSNLLKDLAADQLDAALSKRDRRVPLGRMGSAWDIAKAALFLASDDAAYITGAELVVDGGVTL
jgi:NAD(P)-dependent dehydrogenase (short-subunit alcohol dehydrogenase family)